MECFILLFIPVFICVDWAAVVIVLMMVIGESMNEVSSANRMLLLIA